ncbi:ArsR/SmtB family transcription factor [Kroppenstedtia eburnea]|uniref:ArsR/SmtB family transcription factor n=1 Tax=Kroppenstedtia eburnea TaxID=714067 RepID=UPI00363BD1AC
MTKWRKVDNIELMKLISDPRRHRILHLCSDEPRTVKQLAEALGEQPSRLYYHVNKLVEFEMLEVAETRQVGNLTERVYQTVNLGDVIYRTDPKMVAENPHLAMAAIRQKVDPGLGMFAQMPRILQEREQAGQGIEGFPYHLTIDSNTEYITAKEWMESLRRVHQAWLKEGEEITQWPDPDFPYPFGDENEKGTYQYVLISYRIEDAQQLGLIPPYGDEEETGKQLEKKENDGS